MVLASSARLCGYFLGLALLLLLPVAQGALLPVHQVPEGCTTFVGMNAQQCDAVRNRVPMCNLFLKWTKGCRFTKKPHIRHDGGCKPHDHCGYLCRKECVASKRCEWLFGASAPGGKTGCFKQFTVTKEYRGMLSPPAFLEKSFNLAVAKWRRAILGQEGWGITANTTSLCGGLYELPPMTKVDDLHVVVDIVTVDGVGGSVAAAKPCVLWTDGTAAVAMMRLDRDDLVTWRARGYSPAFYGDVLAHELGHALGFGTLWVMPPSAGVIDEIGPALSRNLLDGDKYLGAGAKEGLAVAHARFRLPPPSPEEPLVETLYGSGSAYMHWSEIKYDTELMTSVLRFGPMPLSAMTAYSLRDLGYVLKPVPLFDEYRPPVDAPLGRRRRLKSKDLPLNEDKVFQDAPESFVMHVMERVVVD